MKFKIQKLAGGGYRCNLHHAVGDGMTELDAVGKALTFLGYSVAKLHYHCDACGQIKSSGPEREYL